MIPQLLLSLGFYIMDKNVLPIDLKALVKYFMTRLLQTRSSNDHDKVSLKAKVVLFSFWKLQKNFTGNSV